MIYAYLRMVASSLAVASTIWAGAAAAEGVRAGTLIENTASASYSTGSGGTTTVDSNRVQVQVDELLDVVIASQDSGAVAIGSGQAVLTYEITNTGNGPEAFDLVADPAVAGNDFDVTIESIVIDNGNGIYEPGVDAVLASGAATPSIDPDRALTVFVIVSAPSGAGDGETSQVNLLAEAATGTGTPGTTFAGAGEEGSDAVVGTTNADADTNGALIASVGTVTLTKSATIADPFGGSEAVPGATVTFTILAEVAGSGSISDLRVTDAIPSGTTYSDGSLLLDGSGLTDASDTDAGSASQAEGVAVQIGTANGGTNYEITFAVTID